MSTTVWAALITLVNAVIGGLVAAGPIAYGAGIPFFHAWALAGALVYLLCYAQSVDRFMSGR